MSHKQQRSVLFPIAKFVADLACRIGGIPTVDHCEKRLKEKAEQIQQIHEQQQALYRVISKIRASLDLDTIFRTTTKETCKLLRVERIAVYRFSEDWGGEFIHDFEFSKPGWNDVETLGRNTVWNDTYLQENQGGRYRNNEMLIVSDIYRAGLSQCHIEMLEQFHIRAYATAPIFIGQQLWGVLAAYQHSQPYQWEELEIQYLSQLASQLGFAVKQAELLEQTAQKAKDLRIANRQQQILFHVITEIRESLDLSTLFSTTATEVRKAMKADRVAIFRFIEDSNYSSGQFVAESVMPAYDSIMNIQVTDHCFGEKYAPQYHQGRMQIISDIYNSNLQHCHIALLRKFEIKAQIILPIMQGSILWGLLCIHQCYETRHWKDSEIQFLQQLATHFNVAIEHAEAILKLEELNRLDPLLQIANRRYLEEVLEKEWQRHRREKFCLSIILLDIDYFGRYNNLYGHPAGDSCLIQITKAIQSVLKRSTDLLARFGGEEFIIILPNTQQEGAIQIANEIQETIRNLKISHEDRPSGQPFVTASMGIANQIPDQNNSQDDLIAKADQALYLAKNSGRDCWMIYSKMKNEE